LYQLLVDALPYLFAFYLLDGLVLLDAHERLFVRTWGSWRLRRGTGVRLAGPWPFSAAVRVYEAPVLVTAAGFYVVRAGASALPGRDEMDFHPFEAGASARREGRSVRYRARAVLRAPTEAAAENVVRLLSEMSAAPDRAAAFRRFLRSAGDVEAARKRVTLYSANARLQVVLATLLFVTTFVALPALLLPGPDATRPLLVAALLALFLHVAVVFATRRTLRVCSVIPPGAALATMAAFPPEAMHAPLLVTKDLLAGADPLAAAAVLLPPAAFEHVARRERHRFETALDAARGTDLEEAWRARVEAVDSIARAAGFDVERVRAAPPRSDAAAAAYCPLCFCEYRGGFSGCSDCGAALRTF
jgi:hypothetical protein